jgi:EAL domain-containing protein (putative c-di-GMP-specific phosphodiesterase class I)
LSNITKSTDAGKVAQKIFNNVTVPYRFKETDINIRCHIGIAVYPVDGGDKAEIVQRAASALAEAKKRNMDFLLFDESLHTQAVARLSLESEIAKAFEKGEFELHYQPVVDTSGRIHGAEALIRWNHPERGLIAPMEFIPIAEETGLIIPIGRWALFTACRQIARWRKKRDLYVSINLSAKEFSDSTLLEAIRKAIKQAQDFDPAYLKLEITETNCMDDPELTIRQMQALLDSGVETFIDDFGTGYSSLGYLKRLPAVTLKIDKLFIDALEDSQQERDYLTHIIRTVKSRRKKVLVEGVSTKEQFELLKAMDCDQMQGYLFSPPVAAARFEALLNRESLL